MNPAQQRLDRARHELNAAEIDAQAQARGHLVAKLAAVRDELKTAREMYAKLRSKIKTERELTATIQKEILEVNAAISTSLQRCPSVYAYLPGDEECRAWKRQHTALEKKLAKLIVRRNAIPQTPVMDAVVFEGDFGIIANLERAQQNILNELSGTRPGQLEKGGLFAVS